MFASVRALFRDLVDLDAAVRGSEDDVPLQRRRVDLMLDSVERAKGSPSPGYVLGTLSRDNAVYYLEDARDAQKAQSAPRVVDLLLDCPSTSMAAFEARADFRYCLGPEWIIAHGGTSTRHPDGRGNTIHFAFGVSPLDDQGAFVMLPHVSDICHVLMIPPAEFKSASWIHTHTFLG